MHTLKHISTWQTSFLLLLSTLIMALSLSAHAKGGVNTNANGVAIKGYDPVAYFVSAKAQKGQAAFEHIHKGNKWHFANQQNKQAFIANPSAYLPQYGGFCAFAASKNSIAPVDPKAWTIRDGKLYLNYSISVREIWTPDIEENIKIADQNWPELKKTVQ